MAKIAIVNEADEIIGAAEKMVARQQGLRHRLVRVFVMRADGKILLHQRSLARKDNPGKWDQSAGGHVDADEDYLTAAKRETKEELGISISEFKTLGKFYIERPAPGGIAKRFQTVLLCRWDGEVQPDPKEIKQVRWLTIAAVDAWLAQSPNDFTKNFGRAFEYLKQAHSLAPFN